MTAPVDELYLKWLYKQVGSVRERDKTQSYWELMLQLYQKEFHWFVPNDHNRVEDGRDLRMIFVHHSGTSPDAEWMGLGCSFLEMLIGLSHRLAFETNRPAKKWFWRLIDNLDLTEATDANYGDQTHAAVDEVMERVMWRTYAPDGSGGMFPLEHPEKDQREVEIWYQLCAYLLDS